MRCLNVAGAVLWGSMLGASCAHDWDDYDPRLGAAGGGVPAGATGTTEVAASVGSSSTEPTASSGSGDGGAGDGGAGPGPATTSGSTSVSSSESSSTGTPTATVEYVATEADCTEPENPNPNACDSDAAPNAFNIDIEDVPSSSTYQGYIAIPVGDVFADKTIDSIQLVLRVSDADRADSESSGEIWRSEPFDRAALDVQAPALPDSAPLAASVGAVALGEEVTFTLTGLELTPNANVYLAVVPLSSDGADYLGERSATPPKLIVTYH